MGQYLKNIRCRAGIPEMSLFYNDLKIDCNYEFWEKVHFMIQWFFTKSTVKRLEKPFSIWLMRVIIGTVKQNCYPDMSKKKKIGILIAGIVELAIVVFVLVTSILVIVTFNDPNTVPNSAEANLEKNGPFIGWLQNNPTNFLLIVLIPIFLILALDIIYLVIVAARRQSNLSDKEQEEIAAQAKKEAREELMREMMAEETAKKNPDDSEKK